MKYNKITNEELSLLKNEILNNSSFSEIGRKLDLSTGTVKRIIEEYKIDLSNYSRLRNTKKRIDPTDEQLDYIKKSFAEGKFKTEICSNLNIKGQQLLAWCKRYNIDLSNYKKASSRTVHFSESDLNKIKSMISEGLTYKEIGSYFNVTRNLIAKTINNNNLIKKKSVKDDFSKEEISALKKLSKKNISLYKAAQCFSVKTDVIKSAIEKYNIDWIYDDSKMDKEKIFDCLSIAIKARKDINSFINKKDFKYLEENLLKKPLIEISKDLKTELKVLRVYINIFILYEILNCENIMTSKMKDMFSEDMLNQDFSHTFIASKYGLSVDAVSNFRKKYFGHKHKLVSQSNCKTSLELEVESLLDSIDLCYFYHKEIDGYEIDYYLGQKIIIEVQGKYWHNNNNKIHLEKDKKKKKYLENLGYNIIYISEDDLKNKKEEIVKNILKMLVKNILI